MYSGLICVVLCSVLFKQTKMKSSAPWKLNIKYTYCKEVTVHIYKNDSIFYILYTIDLMTVAAIDVQWTHYHVHEKYDLDDFSFMTLCVPPEDGHTGHNGINMVSTRLVPLILRGAKKISHTTSSWSINKKQYGSTLSCSLQQFVTLPNVTTENEDSNLATFFQTSTVQLWWVLANCS